MSSHTSVWMFGSISGAVSIRTPRQHCRRRFWGRCGGLARRHARLRCGSPVPLAGALVMTSRRGRDGRQSHLALLDELDSQRHHIGHQCYHGTRRYYYLTNNANHVSGLRPRVRSLRSHKHAGSGLSADPLADDRVAPPDPRDPGSKPPGAGTSRSGPRTARHGRVWDWRHWLPGGWREKLGSCARTGCGSM